MLADALRDRLASGLARMADEGLLKVERVLAGPQGVEIRTADGRSVLNFCANNYLGLSSDPRVAAAARTALDRWGYGLSSVRFICGTQEVHVELERRMAAFLGQDEAILYSSAFDANGGVFEPLLDETSAIVSDELNHASIIDGVRLSKARRFVYRNNDMDDLEDQLEQAREARFKIVVTDGVFSMDGTIAQVDRICERAEAHGALVMVDDSHATGVVGPGGRGTAAHHGVSDRVDLIVTTFGKALGGASGGCIAGRKVLIDTLRQRSRPYLFSNSLMPAIAATTLAVLDLLESSEDLRERLAANTRRFRDGMARAGFRIVPGTHPIVPVLLGHLPNDARVSRDFADALLDEGVYVIGFSFPVVPRGKARIRVQVSAAHTPEMIDFAVEKFTLVGKRLDAI